jgi:hypothetical protein
LISSSQAVVYISLQHSAIVTSLFSIIITNLIVLEFILWTMNLIK